MTPDTVLERLIASFPKFATSWHDADNCFREDDGSFTHCGVFAEFNHFFRSRVVACFLENVATEQFHADFQRYFSGEALRLYSNWHESA